MIDGTEAGGPGERPIGDPVTEVLRVEDAVPAQRTEPPTNLLPEPETNPFPQPFEADAPVPDAPQAESWPAEAAHTEAVEPDEAAEPDDPVAEPRFPQVQLSQLPEMPIAAPQHPGPGLNGDDKLAHAGAEPEAAIGGRTSGIWPGLSAAGLPTRVPQEGDEESIKEAFARSWEATPTSPTPLTRPPFTPRYADEPIRLGATWAEELAPLSPLSAQPPEPKEPPDPARPPEPIEPPQPLEPPKPKEPPTRPAPPGPSPFPSPTPVPTPPQPVPGPGPVPPAPPGPPVPTPPSPFPPPPGPVPPPPAIVPGTAPVIVPGTLAPPTAMPGSVATRRREPGRVGSTGVYQGGNYADLATEPITGVGPVTGRDRAVDSSGSLTGHLLYREMYERRIRRRRTRTVVRVSILLVLFAVFLGAVVTVLAGDFIASLIDTFSRWAS
ncbi:MAG TPA: hypothetical protein VH561_01370 [Micromonosporaceae bacterium]|jgi:hypothetical protein